MRRLGGGVCFGLGSGGGIVNGLLGSNVGRLAATNGRRASFGLCGHVGRGSGARRSGFSRRSGSLSPTGSRRSRCRGLGQAGALFALPPCTDP